MSYELNELKSRLPKTGYFTEAGLYYFPEIDSTNSWLLNEDHVAGKFCLAEKQKAGRGRRGRHWQGAAEGSVLLSMAWDLSKMASKPMLDGLSLVSGLAVIEALQCQNVRRLKLKWPNDIVIEKHQLLHKLGGILVELQGKKLVIGVGINLDLGSVDDILIDQQWTDLASQGAQLNRQILVTDLLRLHDEKIHHCLNQGFGSFKDQWNRLDGLKNCSINILSGQNRTEHQDNGIASGVDDTGALLVRSNSGMQRIHSGEVSVRLQRY